MALETDDTFSGSRLYHARIYAGLSQTDLGERVSVSHQFIAYLENGHRQPTPEVVDAIGEVCGFVPSFFYGPPLEEFRDEECHFRRRTTTPVMVRTRVLAHGTLFGQLVRYFDKKLSLPRPNVPSVRATTPEEIERAAERCRMEWGLGRDVPIDSVTRALENAGVVVTRFHGDAEKVDAFSRSGRRPILVLNADKGSATRSRFDAGHECGHLVLHGGMVTGDPERESEADRFASALLMPRAGFGREFPRSTHLDWPALFRCKKRWGVSVAAIVRRAYDLRLIEAVQYQRAYKYISAKGWRKGEPDEPAHEVPEMIPIAVNVLRKAGTSERDIAGALGWTVGTFTRVSGVQVDEEPPEAPLPGKVIRLVPKPSPQGRLL
jgi:Zn-dependent peptidase ImmA (M78 family)/transcriptional regulator with XRE-family HTH domain